MRMLREKFAVLGYGRLGKALTKELIKNNIEVVAVWNRSERNFQLNGRTPLFIGDLPREELLEADVILLTVSDSAIRSLAKNILYINSVRENQTFFHFSGSKGPELLNLFRVEEGVSIGCIHPYAPIPEEESEESPFAGISMGIDGDPPARELGEKLIRLLGATPFSLKDVDRLLYHLAAVFSSNFFSILTAISTCLLEKSGVQTPNELLLPLIKKTIENIEKKPFPTYLTGPLVRGDVNTIQQHIRKLEKEFPSLSKLYRQLTLSGLHQLQRSQKYRLPANSLTDLLQILEEDE